MNKNIELEVKKREACGTSFSKNYRIKNQIPAVIYGEKKRNENIFIEENQLKKLLLRKNITSSLIELNLEGTNQTVLIKEIQRHQYKNKILHIDFQRVNPNSNVSTKIPIIFLNKKQCVGVKYGGKLNIKMVDVKILCKAKDILEYIEIDVSKLNMNENIRLSDIKNKGRIEFLDQKKGFNRVVVSIKKAKKSQDKTENIGDQNKVENETGKN